MDETNKMDVALTKVKAAPCRRTISVPPPAKAIIMIVKSAPVPKIMRERPAAKTTGTLRSVMKDRSKITNGASGKTAIDNSNQVAFGNDGSDKETGKNPRAIMAAPISAAVL